MKHCAVVATAIVLISMDAALSSAVEPQPQPTEETDWRGAPWWRALRAESYYKECHSSCTEFSQGTKTTVELCDDAKVHLLYVVIADDISRSRAKSPAFPG